MILRPAISSKIFLWVLILGVLLSIGVWSAWDVYLDYKSSIEQEYRLLEVRAHQHEARISGSLRSVNLMLGSIIDDQPDHSIMPTEDNNRLLQNYLRQLPELRSLLITDGTGRVIASNNEKLVGFDAKNREYFKVHRDAPGDDKFHLSLPFKTITGVNATTQSRVIRDSQGQFRGVVVATLESAFFDEALKLSVNEPDSQALLINLNGDILNMVPTSELIGKNLQGGIAYTEHAGSGQAMTRHLNQAKLSSHKKMSVFENLPGAPLTVVVSRDYDKVMADWRESLFWHIGGFLLVASTTLYFFLLAARRQELLFRAQKELQTIIETEPECVKQLAADGTLLSMNRAGLDMIEADSLEQVLGQKMQQLVMPEFRDAFTSLVQSVFDGKPGNLEFEVQGLKGGRRWLETHSVPLRNAQDEIVALLGVTRDISKHKQAEKALREKSRLLDSIVENIPNMVFLKRASDLRFELFNRAGEALVGHSRDEMLGRSDYDLFPKEQADFFVRKDRETLENKDVLDIPEEAIETPNGTRILHTKKLSLKDEHGRPQYLLGISEDITERKAAEEQIINLAFNDSLTQLPNRRLLNDRLNQAIAASKRGGYYCALMFLDLDNFKPLNDKYGHEVGDFLLVEVANRLKSCMRETDTVGRFGGDEFVVLLGELNSSKDTSIRQAKAVAEKIRASLSETYRLSVMHDGPSSTTIEHHCTASIGVTLFSNHEARPDDLLKRADSAMFLAKQAGRNSVMFFEARD